MDDDVAQLERSNNKCYASAFSSIYRYIDYMCMCVSEKAREIKDSTCIEVWFLKITCQLHKNSKDQGWIESPITAKYSI